jgi:hypothetical protein
MLKILLQQYLPLGCLRTAAAPCLDIRQFDSASVGALDVQDFNVNRMVEIIACRIERLIFRGIFYR